MRIYERIPYDDFDGDHLVTVRIPSENEEDYVLNSEGIYVPENENDNLDVSLEED